METMTNTDLATLFDKQPFDLAAFNALKEAAFDRPESLNRLFELLGGLENRVGDNPQPSDAFKLGLCYLVLGDPDHAAELLQKAASIPEHSYYLGQVRREQRRFQEAVAEFEKADRAGVDQSDCDLERAECLLLAGDVPAAHQILSDHAEAAKSSAKYRYVCGRLAEEQGELEKAMDDYEAAVTLDPGHAHAMFHLAYLLDLHGCDDRSLELYLQCSEQPYVYVNALINLAVNFEDEGDYEKAAACLERVLTVNPNHARALLYLKDVLAAKNMYIDEFQLRASEKHDAVLDIPITDFELSVRSRNCLKKMNINTIGDLLRVSEQELLAYKNFGDTSLREIKAMLYQKGLVLGQNAPANPPEPAPAAAATHPQPPSPDPEILSKPVSAIELSVRSRKCLQRLGIASIGDLVSRSEIELLESRNFGHTSLREIKTRLAEIGLSLRQPSPGSVSQLDYSK